MHKFLPALEALREAGHSNAKHLADVLRKSLGQFYGELDPERDDRKLGFVDAFTIAGETKMYTGIIQACAAIGLIATPAMVVPDKGTSREEGADDIKALGEMQEAMALNMPASTVQTLACKACDEIQQTAVKYAEEYMQ